MKKTLGHRSQAPAMTYEKVNKSFPPKPIKNGQNCQQATILGPWRLTEGKQHIEKWPELREEVEQESVAFLPGLLSSLPVRSELI